MLLTACGLGDHDETGRRAADVSETIAELALAATPRYSVLTIDPHRPWTGLVSIEDEASSLPADLVAENGKDPRTSPS